MEQRKRFILQQSPVVQQRLVELKVSRGRCAVSAPSSGGTFQLPVTERFRRFKLWPKTLSLRTFCNPLYYYAKEGSSTRCDQYPAGEDTQWQHQSNKLANQRVTEAIGLEDQSIFLVPMSRGSCQVNFVGTLCTN